MSMADSSRKSDANSAERERKKQEVTTHPDEVPPIRNEEDPPRDEKQERGGWNEEARDETPAGGTASHDTPFLL